MDYKSIHLRCASVWRNRHTTPAWVKPYGICERKAYQSARKLSASHARRDAFRDLRSLVGFSDYGLHAWATHHVSHTLLGDHLDVNMIQTIATRAFRAVEQYGFGVRGRPRFKGRNQIDSLEGKGNKQGLRWKDGALVWGDLTLTGIIATNPSIDPATNPVLSHGLTRPIKYVQLIRRRLNGRVRFSAQLMCEGQQYRKAQHSVRAAISDHCTRTWKARSDRGWTVLLVPTRSQGYSKPPALAGVHDRPT